MLQTTLARPAQTRRFDRFLTSWHKVWTAIWWTFWHLPWLFCWRIPSFMLVFVYASFFGCLGHVRKSGQRWWIRLVSVGGLIALPLVAIVLAAPVLWAAVLIVYLLMR